MAHSVDGTAATTAQFPRCGGVSRLNLADMRAVSVATDASTEDERFADLPPKICAAGGERLKELGVMEAD
eukprot:scaffold86948_cov33-Tisochrysis_lutea.AAC.6